MDYLPFKSYGMKKPMCKLDRAHSELFSLTSEINEARQVLDGQLVNQALPWASEAGYRGRRLVRVGKIYRRWATAQHAVIVMRIRNLQEQRNCST